MNGEGSNGLCFECGLCCNGVIFADVELQPTEARSLRSKVQNLKWGQKNRHLEVTKLPQPCAAFDGCRCRVYADRPNYCRRFECLLLKDVHAGRLGREAALRIIRTAKQRAEKVRRLLRDM